MLHLLRKQIILFFVLAFSGQIVHAQFEPNRSNHDNLPYYFGMSISYNHSYLHPNGKHNKFLQDDSVLVAEPGASGGIGLGLLATMRLNSRFSLRLNPQLIIGGSKYFTYNLSNPGPGEYPTETKTLPSTIVSFPVQVKFNSDRIGNFRTFLMAGVKYDIDLASNSAARNADDLVKLKRSDFGYEAGIGFNFFLPFVTFSPELKISNGITNVHSRDANLKYSSALDRLNSRMIVFSIILED